MAELRYLWSTEVLEGLHIAHEDEVLLVDPRRQTVASKDIASGLSRGFSLSCPYVRAKGPPVLSVGIVTDELQQKHVALLHHQGFAERWSLEAVQLEGTFAWRSKVNFEVGAVTKRPGDMIGFVAQRNPSTALHCVRLDTGAVAQSRLEFGSDKPKGQIVQMLCHPKQPWLAVSYSRGTVQIWDYSALLGASSGAASGQSVAGVDAMGGYGGSGGVGAGGGAGGEGGSDMMAEEHDVQLTTTQLTLIGLIQSPASGDAAVATYVEFHPHENLMLCVFGGVVLATYDLTPLAAAVNEEFATGSIRSGTGKDRDLRASIQRLEPIASTASLPRNWLITSAAFDVDYPIVYTGVQRWVDSRVHSCLLAAHTLLEPSLRICLTLPLRGLGCSSISMGTGGQVLCVCQEPRPSRKATGSFRFRLHAVNVMRPNESAWGKAALSSRSPLPPDAFTQTARLPRFAYYVRQAKTISTSGLRPFSTTASVYRHRIGSSSLRKAAQKPELCFAIPSTVSNQSKCQTVQIEGTLRDGPFLPTQIKVAADGSCFCIVGTVVAPAATEEHRAAISHLLQGCPDTELGNHEVVGAFPAIAVVFAPQAGGDEGVAPQPSFIPCQDAIFWVAPARPDSADSTKGETLLCLNQGGTKVIWLSRNGEVLSTWTPRLPLSRLFGCTTRDNQPALLVSFSRRETQYLCASASPEILEHTSRWFQCQPKERILDAQWQPLPSVYQQPGAAQEELDAQRPWVAHRAGALIAVLTNYRVLILNPDMEILTEREFSTSTIQVQSIFWLGLAVLMIRENGVVEYLIPAHLPTALVKIDESQPYAGLFKGSLCALPTSRAIDIVTCLPDRLVYSSQLQQQNIGDVILNRPCVSVEPLVLGLIASALPLDGSKQRTNAARQSDMHANQRVSILKSLIFAYVYPKQAFGVAARTDDGAHPTTHVTDRLARVLLRSGHAGLASVLVGIQTSSHEFGQSYESHAWLPREAKFDVAVSVKRYDESILETLASDPGLQELYLEPESLGAGGLPHPKARLAKGLQHMSRVLATAGVIDVAAKVADMAGDDVKLASYFLSCSKGNDGARRDLEALAASNQARNPHLAHFFEALAAAPVPERSASPPPINSNDVGSSARRPGLLHMASKIDRQQTTHAIADGLDVATLHAEHNSVFSHSGMRLGPHNKALDVLAADTIEDYMGRTVMECIEVEVSASPLSQGAVHPAEAIAGSHEAIEPGVGVDRSFWVEGVGKGRGDDRVVGYWRFGDIAKPGSDDFVSSCEPAARANMPDISRFGNVLELVSEGALVSVAESQSPVDQGESSVKSAFDVIFNDTPLEPSNGVAVGLRCNVTRGSSLDVGFYHDESSRARMTFEMWIRRDDDQPLSDGQPHVLATRVLPAENTQFTTAALWTILVDGEGHLVFRTGGTLPGCDPSTALPQEEIKASNASIAVGLWTHIAVVVDTSLSEYVPYVPGKPYEAQRAAVSLFVNAEREGASTIQLPTLTEAQLSRTLMYLGYNLRSWKATEVRIWATLRSDLDLADTKENYLHLASSHRRLTIKMSASSRSSSVLSSNSAPTLESQSSAPTGRLSLPRGSLSLATAPSGLVSAPGDSSRPNRRAKARRSLASNSQSLPALGSTPGVSPTSNKAHALESVSEAVNQGEKRDDKDTVQIPDHPPPPVPPKQRPSVTLSSAVDEGVQRLGQLHDAQIGTLDVLRDIRTSLFSSSALFAVCIAGKSEELNGLCVMEAIPSVSTLAFTRFKIQAESVIMSPTKSSKVIGMYARAVLAVFDITTKRKVAEQKMAAPLVYWAWLDTQTIVLVLSNAVFKWTIQFEPGATTAPPVKLFDRADIDRTEPSQWSQRRALQFGQSSDGRWASVLSAERHRADHPVDQFELLQTSRVSIHDSTTNGEAKVVNAVASAFCDVSGDNAMLLVHGGSSGVGLSASLQLLCDSNVLSSDDAWQHAQRWTTELPAHEAVGTLNSAYLSAGAWSWVIDATVVVLSYDGTLHMLDLLTGAALHPPKFLSAEGVLSASMRIDDSTSKQSVFALGRESGTVYCLPVL